MSATRILNTHGTKAFSLAKVSSELIDYVTCICLHTLSMCDIHTICSSLFLHSLVNFFMSVCMLTLAQTLATTTIATTTTAATTTALVCPVCGVNQVTGQLSCCARGGSWYENCGNLGEPNVDYTWAQGINTCKCKLSDRC